MRNCCRLAVFLYGSVALMLSGVCGLGALPVVKMAVVEGVATESGVSNGLVRIERVGGTTGALSVEYEVRGTAVAGKDVYRLPGRVKIPEGEAGVTFEVRGIDDGEEEGVEEVELRLVGSMRPFTVVVVPDTQFYTYQYYNNLDLFARQVRWIMDERDARNVRFVLHEGDCTQMNTWPEWLNFKRYMRLLDGVVPYAVAVGNHDGLGTALEDTSYFNACFPVSAFAGLPSFGGVYEAGKMDNCYHLFSAGGVDWLVLSMEFGPREGVLGWANEVVAAHPNRRVMVVTHTHIYSDDSLHGSSPGHFWTPTSYGRTNNGPEVWDKFLRRHGNISFVFNGHILNDGAGRLVGIGDHGNKVYQMLANYQMLPNGGQGYLRLVEFVPEEDRMAVRTYSPALRRFMDGDEQEFEYRNLGIFSGTNVAYTIDGEASVARVLVMDDDRDTSAPWVAGAEASGIPAEVRLTMNEPVDAVSASVLENYHMSHSIDLGGVQVSGDGRVITLLPIVQLSTGVTYTVTLANIRDRALTPNSAGELEAQFTWSPVFLTETFEAEQLRDWVVVDEGTVDGPSSWNVRLGRLEQSANIFGPDAQATSGRKGTFVWWSKAAAAGWSNYNCSAVMRSSDDDGIGLLFRFRDAGNYYKLELDRQHDFRRLVKVVNGVETLLASDAGGYPQDQDVYVVIECKGAEIKASVDGEMLFGGPVADGSLMSGSIGLYCWGNEAATFDNVWVVPDGESLPPPASTNTARTITIETLQPIDGWWKYWSAVAAPNAAWRQPGFNDNSWVGPARAVFSFGANGLGVPSNTLLTNGPPAFYFRKHFNFAGVTNGVTLRLRHWVDDGAVFYLNGTELVRIGMPAGTIAHNTLATRNVATAVLEGPFDIPVNNLLVGDNVLAVEVHQATLPNPDLVFAAEVEALIPVTEPATFRSARLLSTGRLQVIMAGQTGRSYVIQSSTNMVNWGDLMVRSNLPNPIVSLLLDVTNAPQQFFRAVTLP